MEHVERPVELDLSALSPAEYDAYLGFAGEMSGELERKGGQMRFAEAAMVIRRWFEFDAEKEDEIRCFFPQKTQLGGMRLGSSLVVLRLLAHARAYPNTSLILDHVFTQTRPLPSSKAPGVSSPLSRSNPFRKAETPQTTTIDTSPHFMSSERASPLPSLGAAASPLVQTPASNVNRSPPFDSNPFRNRTRSGPDVPISPSAATAASMSPPLPPRPQDRDVALKGPPPPPPPKHHSRQQTQSDAHVEPAPRPSGRAKLSRSDSSPPTSRPATVRRSSGAIVTSAARPPRPKIQTTTSSGYGTWIITPDGTGGSTGTSAAPAPGPKPKLLSSTHLGIDTTLRGSNLSPQPTGTAMAPSTSLGGGADDDARPRLARPPSDISVGSSTGHRHGGATGLTPGMGLQYQTIASSTSPRLGTVPDPGPPLPPPLPRKKRAPADTRSQPETSAGPFADQSAADDDDVPAPWPGLGRSKTIGHAAAAKGPPPAPPPRRTSTIHAGRLHNPHAASLEDVARQPTGDAEPSSFSPPLPPQNHRRVSSNSQTAALKNFKALESGLATKAAHLRQDSRNIVKDIQDGWSRRHGKPDERQGLVGSRKGTGSASKGKDGWAEEASGDEEGWDRLE